MYQCTSFFFALTAALALGWLYAALLLFYWFRRMPWLQDTEPLPDEDCPMISLLVAARNEKEKIRGAIETWLALDYPKLEIIIVNDRSTDSTGAIIDELAARDNRIKVIHNHELPGGWLGKSHAITRAYEHSTGEWLLLTDADVHLDPDVLRRTLSLARKQGWDHTTAPAHMDLRSFGEKLIVTYMGLGFFLNFRPWAATNPRSKVYMGVGAFQMIRRTAYEAVGTHRRLALDVLEDMKLGKLVKEAGIATGVFLPGDKIRVRWVSSLGEFIHNSEKNFFAVTDYSVFKALLIVSQMLFAGVLPFALLPFLALSGGWPWTLDVVAVALILGIHGTTCVFSRVNPLYAVFHPVAALLMAFIVLRAMTLNLWKGGIVWRGTFHSLDDLRRGMV